MSIKLQPFVHEVFREVCLQLTNELRGILMHQKKQKRHKWWWIIRRNKCGETILKELSLQDCNSYRNDSRMSEDKFKKLLQRLAEYPLQLFSDFKVLVSQFLLFLLL